MFDMASSMSGSVGCAVRSRSAAAISMPDWRSTPAAADACGPARRIASPGLEDDTPARFVTSGAPMSDARAERAQLVQQRLRALAAEALRHVRLRPAPGRPRGLERGAPVR